MDWNNINRDRDTSGLGPIEYDQSKVPQLIRKHADNVRTKTYGQEVREAQARNAELAGLIASEANELSTNIKGRQDVIESRYDVAVGAMTSETEILDARVNSTGAISPNLKERLDNGEFFVNVKAYGAKGDGVTDDREAIQAAIDDIFEAGGGVVYFPLGTYLISSPLLLKSVSEFGGYDANFVELRGAGNSKSRILKTDTTTTTVKNGTANTILDAAIIGIGGITEDISAPVTSVKFKDIKVSNLSTNLTTYGVYIARGSRILADYSSFETLRTTTDLANHNRYAFFAGSTWSTSYRDCTFHGDHGFYQTHNSTSLLMENIYSSGLKSSYKITSAYTTLINVFGDYAQGTMFDFSYASVEVIGMGAESHLCEIMIKAFNSEVNINSAYIYKNETSETANFIVSAGSNLKINKLDVVSSGDVDFGHFIKDGTRNNIQIDDIKFSGTGKKFLTTDIDTSKGSSIKISKRAKWSDIDGTRRLLDLPSKSEGGYLDYYLASPKYKTNNIIFGLKSPHVNMAGESVRWDGSSSDNDVFINADYTDRQVFGWVKKGASVDLSSGTFNYVPLILSGTTANRPTWQTTGMQYFDTTLRKPVWWSGTTWVDATGTTV